MICGDGCLVKNDRAAPAAITLRCKRWSCEHCRPYRQAEVRALVRAGEPKLMITLTDRATDDGSPDDAARRLVRAWQLIHKRLKRQSGEKSIAYFTVIEATKRGWPHLHILLRRTYVEHGWLKAALREITGSTIVWLTRLRSARGGATYVSKYLGKAPHHYDGCKRYWRSQDWIADRPAWDEAHAKSEDRWHRDGSHITEVARDYEYAGYIVTWSGSDRFSAEPKCYINDVIDMCQKIIEKSKRARHGR